MPSHHRHTAYLGKLACAIVIAASTGSATLAQGTVGKEAVEAVRVPGCEQSSLSAGDRTACAARMGKATDNAERAEIQKHYEAVAQGNRLEGDGVPTASPPPDPQPEGGLRAEIDVAPGATGLTGAMGASDAVWLLAIGGGTAILGIALFYGVTRRRRDSAAAKAAQDRGTNAAYGHTERQPPRR